MRYNYEDMNDQQIVFGVFQFVVLIFSVVVHEVAHGVTAERLGDPTARLLGRLTLNPIRHLDPMGSFILPLMLYFSGLPILGWAKPVPYNPFVLKDPKKGGGMIALAGPATNMFLAAAFGAAIRIMVAAGMTATAPILILLLVLIVKINLILAIFNLVPIPPLDGSKVLFAFLPNTPWARNAEIFLERIGWPLVFFVVFFGFGLIQPVVNVLFALFVGPLALGL